MFADVNDTCNASDLNGSCNLVCYRETSLSQYPIEFDSIQEEIGRRVWLFGTQELQNCGWIEAAGMGRSWVLDQMSMRCITCAISREEK